MMSADEQSLTELLERFGDAGHLELRAAVTEYAADVAPSLGPFAARAGTISHGVESQTSGVCRFFHVALEVDPPLPAAPKATHVPALLYADRPRSSPALSEATVRWEASLAPGCLEPFFSRGALRLGENLDWDTAHWADIAFLEPLLEPHTHQGPMATLLLALGLAAREAGQRTMATDALVVAVYQGRLDAAALGACMATLLPTGLVKAARWAHTLAEAARSSGRHSERVATVIQACLRGDAAAAPRDVGKLLALLLELLSAMGSPLNDPAARAFLQGMKRGGAAGKAKQALLRCGQGEPSP